MNEPRMDDRLKKELGDSRRTRGHTDRLATENRAYTEDERLEMFRMQLYNDRLPNLPDIPGFHVCWLTTANTGDTIQSRSRMGYELIRAEDVPGMDLIIQKTGDYVGCVMVNEMIAAKLPTSLYLRYMQEAHHDAPLREEQSLADQSDAIREQLMRSGSNVTEGDGLSELRQSNPARGVFTD